MEEAIADLQAGKFIIVVDDEGRENEGDLVLPAEKVTPEAVNFMVTHAKGLLCMPMTEERLDELQIPLVSTEHTPTSLPTAFTVSIDYKKGTTTGISAFDRSATINALIDPNCQPDDFARPGHLFPLRYHKGGVLMRPGHTEAIIDLCNIGGFTEAKKVAGWCEPHYIDLMPHNPLGPICVAATSHLAMATPNFSWLEIRESSGESTGFYSKEIFPVQPEIVPGKVTVLNQPGLGVDVDETSLTKPFQFSETPHLKRKDGSHTNW